MKLRWYEWLVFAVVAVLALLWLSGRAMAQGVVPEDTPVNQVFEIDGTAHADALSARAHDTIGQLPVDDSERWRIEFFTTRGCGSCERLKAAFERHPVLRGLKEQCHFLIHDRSRRGQEQWFRNFRVRVYPTVVISPPRHSDLWPYQQVFRREGFDGNADAYAQDVLEAIEKFGEKHGRDRWRPFRPEPQPRPQPQPWNFEWPDVTPWQPDRDRPDRPHLPNFPPDRDRDRDRDRPNDEQATYPLYPTITVVTDPQGLRETVKAKAVEMLAERLAEKYGVSHKIRLLTLSEAQEMGLPVRAIDTPALVGSREGRMTAYLAGSVVPLLMQQQRAWPVEDDTVLFGLGWGMLILIAGAVLIVWLLVRAKQEQSESATTDSPASADDGYQFGDFSRGVLARIGLAEREADAAKMKAERAKREAAREAEDRAEAAKAQAKQAEQDAAAAKALNEPKAAE